MNFAHFFAILPNAKKIEQQLHLLQLSQIDPLTGVPNRTIFNDGIVEAMNRNQRTHSLPALLSIDIDRFKLVNDNYGPKMGDCLLKEYARRLHASIRATDTIARLDGDQFTIILEELKSPTDAEAVASKIIESVCKSMQIDDIHLTVTTSIGIAFYPDELDADELIHHTDQAMYRAKKAGRIRTGR